MRLPGTYELDGLPYDGTRRYMYADTCKRLTGYSKRQLVMNDNELMNLWGYQALMNTTTSPTMPVAPVDTSTWILVKDLHGIA
jgi:hypothetical protein